MIETLLGHYIRMPPVPLSLKIYIPTDTATVLRIVRNAAGERGSGETGWGEGGAVPDGRYRGVYFVGLGLGA